MDTSSLRYFQEKAEKGEILLSKLEYCQKILNDIEEGGMKHISFYVSTGKAEFKTGDYHINIRNQDSVDCFGDIALQVIKDLRDRYQAEFDAL